MALAATAASEGAAALAAAALAAAAVAAAVAAVAAAAAVGHRRHRTRARNGPSPPFPRAAPAVHTRPQLSGQGVRAARRWDRRQALLLLLRGWTTRLIPLALCLLGSRCADSPTRFEPCTHGTSRRHRNFASSCLRRRLQRTVPHRMTDVSCCDGGTRITLRRRSHETVRERRRVVCRQYGTLGFRQFGF